jgi:hypothetical protein
MVVSAIVRRRDVASPPLSVCIVLLLRAAFVVGRLGHVQAECKFHTSSLGAKIHRSVELNIN